MSQRTRRVGEAIKEILAERLPELKDPRIGFVTLTDVRVTPDLAHAEVFYTVLPDDADTRAATAQGLASATPVLRHDVGADLRLKRVPDLHFTHDPVPAHARHIEELLGATRAQESSDDR